MNTKDKERKKAVLLRQQGHSYNEILEQVPVSKSSLSIWLRGIHLDSEAQVKLAQKRRKGGYAAPGTRERFRKAREDRKRPEKRMTGHPKWKGEVSESAFIARCVRNNIRLSIPFGDNAPYDALIDVGGSIKKIQVKTIAFDEYDHNVVTIKRTRYADGKMRTETYDDGDFDIFVGYCPERDRFVLMPWEAIPDSGTLVVRFDSPCKWTPFIENWTLLEAQP